jgi:chromosome segregation ATPase
MEEQMESSTELAKLEQFVDKLLTKYHELKDNFHSLQATLRERDSEIADLKEQVAELSSERAHVGERVAGLIGRIEEWEAEQEDGAETLVDEMENTEGNTEDASGLQGSLFHEGADNS